MILQAFSALSIAEQAAILRRGLEYGYVTTAEAVSWADYHIEAEQAVPDDLFDLSLSSRKDPRDIAMFLSDLTSGVEMTQLIRQHVQFMIQVLREEPNRASKIAWSSYDMSLSQVFGAGAPDGDLIAVAYEFDPDEAAYASSPEQAAAWLNDSLCKIDTWLKTAV